MFSHLYLPSWVASVVNSCLLRMILSANFSRIRQSVGRSVVDLEISDAGLVNFVCTKWLRLTYSGKNYAIFPFNSLNLHQAPVSLVRREEVCLQVIKLR